MFEKLSVFAIESNGVRMNSVSTDRILCVVGKEEIHHIEPGSNCVLISITEPESEFIAESTRNRYADTLNIQFWDTTVEKVSSLRAYRDKTKKIVDCISYDEAKTIYDFIMLHHDKQFAIHCHAGISRSAATAQAILCLLECNGDLYEYRTCFDDPVKKHWRYHPNSTVFDRIIASHILN